MTTTFPRSPRTLKGAIVGLDPLNPLASVVIFQYNPATMTRTLAPAFGGQGGAGIEALRLHGAPLETIKVDVEIDASDQFENNDPIALSMGIHPQLAALEMLVYPKSAQVITNTVLLAAGSLNIIPPAAPLTLLVWGAARVLPVKLTEFSVVEEAFDPQLNPIRAKVGLGMQVLSYNDLPFDHPGHTLFLAHQVLKETMAVLGSAANVASAVGG
jgi:hypothetical protein